MEENIVITNEQLIDTEGNVYYVELWDHKSKINNVDVELLYISYPWVKEPSANVILVLINNSYETTQRVEDPEILRSNFGLAEDATIEDIMSRLRKEIYDEFERQKEALKNPQPVFDPIEAK